jgi:pimeloyl-ACP methyl ester carboxylesterase
LHYVEAGDGPLIVLLHGFPEFWYGWRRQIEPLAAAGFRVVAPDMRGYNLSSKPDGLKAYDTGQLAADIRAAHHLQVGSPADTASPCLVQLIGSPRSASTRCGRCRAG